MSYFIENPDYTLGWPAEIFAAEAERLAERGRRFGIDQAWRSEVQTLLSQAFPSSVPKQDFERLRRFDPAEEPF